MMHLHILGIGGTFMSGLALLAREAGFKVTGSDANCYPPISDLLSAQGIEWTEGYEDTKEALRADTVIVGNAMKRGMGVLEALLEKGKSYTSGPQWLAENILNQYKVIAIAGTHGKTTTTSMLSWILAEAGKDPAFLIGGVAQNFNSSARLGKGEWFVIEADEYDSAFFDKRPKFMHYRPRIAVLNNLEFDHADIYADLAAIQKQFHYFNKTIPGSGIVIKPKEDKALNEVMSLGYYSRVEETSIVSEDAQWAAQLLNGDNSSFEIFYQGKKAAEIHWAVMGAFNRENALSALAASFHAGISPKTAAKALESFSPVKRRLEVKANRHGITVYDDFAHHPTAIRKTIEALRSSNKHQRILVVMEFASYTMRSGFHAQDMVKSLALADRAYILQPKDFSFDDNAGFYMLPETGAIIQAVVKEAQQGDAILIMSNKSFDNIQKKLVQRLDEKFLILSQGGVYG